MVSQSSSLTLAKWSFLFSSLYLYNPWKCLERLVNNVALTLFGCNGLLLFMVSVIVHLHRSAFGKDSHFLSCESGQIPPPIGYSQLCLQLLATERLLTIIRLNFIPSVTDDNPHKIYDSDKKKMLEDSISTTFWKVHLAGKAYLSKEGSFIIISTVWSICSAHILLHKSSDP